jgi:hypothetical protein
MESLAGRASMTQPAGHDMRHEAGDRCDRLQRELQAPGNHPEHSAEQGGSA